MAAEPSPTRSRSRTHSGRAPSSPRSVPPSVTSTIDYEHGGHSVASTREYRSESNGSARHPPQDENDEDDDEEDLIQLPLQPHADDDDPAAPGAAASSSTTSLVEEHLRQSSSGSAAKEPDNKKMRRDDRDPGYLADEQVLLTLHHLDHIYATTTSTSSKAPHHLDHIYSTTTSTSSKDKHMHPISPLPLPTSSDRCPSSSSVAK
eukprot:690010-Amphidinium_carterae.1